MLFVKIYMTNYFSMDLIQPSHAEVANSVISVENASKMYYIYERPQDRLLQMLWHGRREYGQQFWALRDTSFQVQRGETIGIIGRNGSGKSTLLQIIAGTLAPTTGQVRVNGRVAALLELGSGFNPEFTGRENIFLNGSILGITREEMNSRIDDIVSFADIGNFIDQPVRTYSSGMMLRLAFAVQIHVDADVLIIDEALGVGDVFFQAKCSRHLQKFRDDGGTLLFVSHDMYAVERLCSKGLLLDKGVTRWWGDIAQAVNLYYHLERNSTPLVKLPNGDRTTEGVPTLIQKGDTDTISQALVHLQPSVIRRESATSNGSGIIESLYIANEQNKNATRFDIDQWMDVYIVAKFFEDIENVDFGVGLCDRSAVLLGGAHSWYQPRSDRTVNVEAGQRWLFHCRIRLATAPGEYLLLVGLARNFSYSVWEDIYVLLDACTIQVAGRTQFWGQFHFDTVVSKPEKL